MQGHHNSINIMYIITYINPAVYAGYIGMVDGGGRTKSNHNFVYLEPLERLAHLHVSRLTRTIPEWTR